MVLFLIRHADASWSTSGQQTDYNRELSARGKKDLLIMKEQMVQREWLASRILFSPARRTRATCDGLDLNGEEEESLYLASASQIKILVDKHNDSESLMIICHNPGLIEFVNSFCQGGINHFPTLGICKIEWTDQKHFVSEFIFPDMFPNT